MTTFQPVPVYFKKVFTEQSKTYLVYPDWTITQFQAAIRPLISIDFNIESENIELVETGQDDSENASAIQIINDTKMYEVWTSALNVSFYVRFN